MICLEISGNPIPARRPRFHRVGTFVTTYDPQQKLKEAWKWQIKSQFNGEPLLIPLVLNASFFLPIPTSVSKCKRRQMITGEISHITKPDIDNLTKFLLDCLNKIVYQDDAQIIQISVKKSYSNQPGTHVLIKTINELKMESTDAS